MTDNFTHIVDGRVHMVDISDKNTVTRQATATGVIVLSRQTIDRIRKGLVEKGNVFSTARIAAILAVKRTPEIIPMCHQIPISSVDVDLTIEGETVRSTVEVRSNARTGVEMEALNGVSTALLTVWDMVKSAEKDSSGNYPDTVINDIRVVRKTKGNYEIRSQE
ncbi:molybdenum cofactor biosynthesis protein C [Methanosalsum zhilinae DSM 4017]|uniref:Probable cyclic pyranopterin monophosphate synthase n=1 Tax=Methanosalsum zhilinae (strain DSM 4017 / NBRC 107636 / OCM 62 / WeN5) TaxID=679901 RepID=F7XKH1_METZD|nr:cyclic pyranopterin monophosphate synthase MoaC [Methanosalsum zhilinae]AEH61745.1 molybdenum cofactor biosynthesis protein C [Methanosalsum zhilinae DSM 4017]